MSPHLDMSMLKTAALTFSIIGLVVSPLPDSKRFPASVDTINPRILVVMKGKGHLSSPLDGLKVGKVNLDAKSSKLCRMCLQEMKQR